MEVFLNSPEYKVLKTKYEKNYFKLFGKYCQFHGEKITDKLPAEMAEYFKNKIISLEVTETSTTKKGVTTSTSHNLAKDFYQIWSHDPEMREYIEVVFNCNVSKVKPTQFNLFDGFEHFNDNKKKDVNLEPIFEHMRSLVNDNEEHFNYVLDYLAQLIQQPHILPHTSLIFISDEGVGKDIFADFLSSVMSEKYTHNTEKLELIWGNFNTILGGKLLMVINETNPIESAGRIENIKFLITAEKITIHGKFKDPIKCDNFCRFIFFSNRLFAFPVEEGSRRPVIFKSSSKNLKQNIGEKENFKYFDRLANKTNGIYRNVDYQYAFLRFLKDRDISKFNPKNFKRSELHEALEENSISPIVSFIGTLIEGIDEDIIKLSTTDVLKQCNQFMRDRNYKYDFTQKNFNVNLSSMFNITTTKSGSMYFVIDIKHVKKVLVDKYKYKFDVVEEEVEVFTKPSPLDYLDEKIVIKNLTDENKNLKQELEELKLLLAKKNKKKLKKTIEELQEIESELDNNQN